MDGMLVKWALRQYQRQNGAKALILRALLTGSDIP